MSEPIGALGNTRAVLKKLGQRTGRISEHGWTCEMCGMHTCSCQSLIISYCCGQEYHPQLQLFAQAHPNSHAAREFREADGRFSDKLPTPLLVRRSRSNAD